VRSSHVPPSFRVTDVSDTSARLHYYSKRPGLGPVVMGMVIVYATLILALNLLADLLYAVLDPRVRLA